VNLIRTVAITVTLWLTTITLLHDGPNLDWSAKKLETGEERTFGVGFLPVACHLNCPVTDFIDQNLNGRDS
jgi:NitT/TauT family transport system substrate-binding protein